MCHRSALLNAGYEVSRSHALSGSLKTNAPRSFIFDIMREWVKEHPVKMENLKDGQIAHRLLSKAQGYVFFGPRMLFMLTIHKGHQLTLANIQMPSLAPLELSWFAIK